ncbi:MAG: hypothetical protein WCA00_01335 [Candidatus Acidiferrales bacterium]
MRILRRFGMSCLVVAAMALGVSAQMGMGMRGAPQLRGILNPVVGSGGQYEITTAKGEKMSMEMVIVGKETVDGKAAYWFENTMTSERMGGEMVVKALTVVDGQDTVVSRMIMQMPNHPPMEMPAQMVQMHGQKRPTDIRSEAEDVGSESVTTPAGTFATEHYKMKDGSGDMWIAAKAGPYGLVKFQGKDSTMLLTKVITDGKDKITGTPQPFNPMMFGQDQQHP